jgi:HD superfamily phosphodiesterase
VRLATGIRGSTDLDLDELKIPDSRLAKDATVEARDVLSPHVLRHSHRTYLFGLALAKAGRVTIDEELCYVAAMLHDTHR